MNSDGSGNTNLTASDEDDDTPDWSPDGGQIVWERAVATTTGEQHDIWRMDADGSNERAVTDTSEADDYWPAWAPNGRRIAFRSNIEGGGVAKAYDVFTVRVGGAPAGGSGYDRITTDGMNNHRPAWSPDGTTIAFDKARDLDPDRVDVERDVWTQPVSGGCRSGSPTAPAPTSLRSGGRRHQRAERQPRAGYRCSMANDSSRRPSSTIAAWNSSGSSCGLSLTASYSSSRRWHVSSPGSSAIGDSCAVPSATT